MSATTRPDLSFESSPARIAFRMAAGDANRILNTHLVALETLKTAVPVVPVDLVVPWSLPANAREWEESRSAALKSTMVAVVDGLDQFMKVLSRIPGLALPTLDDALNGRATSPGSRRPTVYERLDVLAAAYPGVVLDQHLAAMHLLVLWRNIFVHRDYRFSLNLPERKVLTANATWFKTSHGGADINGALARYDAKAAPTLADLSTLIASAHRIVTALDDRLIHARAARPYATALMTYLIQNSGDPAAFIDRIWEHGGRHAVGAAHAHFLDNGANHGSHRLASAPLLTAADMNDLFSYGRNEAGITFGVTLEKRKTVPKRPKKTP